MRRALITGASKGIGKACVDRLRSQYEIVTVARTGDVTEAGDVCDPQFVEHLLQKYEIDLLVNSVGALDEDFESALRTNFFGPARLTAGFYEKMDAGHIINITSEAALKVGWEAMSPERAYYQVAKNSLKKLSQVLEESRRRNVRVTSLEPGWVNTSFGGVHPLNIDYTKFPEKTEALIPMPPEYIAEIVEWVLKQPPFVTIHSLCVRNFKFHPPER